MDGPRTLAGGARSKSPRTWAGQAMTTGGMQSVSSWMSLTLSFAEMCLWRKQRGVGSARTQSDQMEGRSNGEMQRGMKHDDDDRLCRCSLSSLVAHAFTQATPDPPNPTQPHNYNHISLADDTIRQALVPRPWMAIGAVNHCSMRKEFRPSWSRLCACLGGPGQTRLDMT